MKKNLWHNNKSNWLNNMSNSNIKKKEMIKEIDRKNIIKIKNWINFDTKIRKWANDEDNNLCLKNLDG